MTNDDFNDQFQIRVRRKGILRNWKNALQGSVDGKNHHSRMELCANAFATLPDRMWM